MEDRSGVKEAVRSLNIPTATPKRRVPESLLFCNTCRGLPNDLHDEVENKHIQYLLYLKVIF
jgi:hypothetical protein